MSGAERHGGDFCDGALASLALLPGKVDAEADRQAWSAALHLAERHRLTVYDAAYRRSLLAGKSRSPRWIGNCAPLP